MQYGRPLILPEFWLGVHGIRQHISSIAWIMES